MQLDHELSKALRPNEHARLRCAETCSMSRHCVGLEALSLDRLRLAVANENGFAKTALGYAVTQIADPSHATAAPILRLK